MWLISLDTIIVPLPKYYSLLILSILQTYVYYYFFHH